MKYTLTKGIKDVFLHSKNNVITQVDKGFIYLSGYSESELLGKSLLEISNLLRIDFQIYLENIKNSRSCYIFTKNLEPKEVIISCKIQMCESEKIYIFNEKRNSKFEDTWTCISSLCSDKEFALAIYSAPEFYLLKANDNYLNNSCFGFNQNEIVLGKPIREASSKNNLSIFENILLDIIKTGKAHYKNDFKYEALGKETTYWDISIVPIFAAGKVKYIVHTAENVTERVINRKLVEKRKQQLETTVENMKLQELKLIKIQYDILNNIIENLDLGCSRFSYPDYKIQYVNAKGFNTLMKFNPNAGDLSSLIGKNSLDVFQHSIEKREQIKSSIQNLIDTKASSFSIYKTAVMPEEERFFKILYQPLFGLNNKIVEFISIAIDITEEVQAKNKIEQTLKVQDEIFSNISHELKTPLNVIFSTNQLMELYLKNGLFESNKDKLYESINTIKQNCYRFMKLVNNIIDMTKIDSGFFTADLANENIVEVVEGIVQSASEYTSGKGVSITFDTNTEEKVIACNLNSIKRIILNLISNAIKFTKSGDSIFVNLIDRDKTVEISVEDTGIGIDQDKLDSIFERFYQVDKSLSRKTEGIGIGLTIAKLLVEIHEGTITVDSKVGKGTVFKVELPVRTLEKDKEVAYRTPLTDNIIEMTNIEFSDIY